MTQLGELQDALPRFRAAGLKLYGISYDLPAALAAFARARGIDFPLLSDPDSAVIRRFGILNTLVPEEDVPFYGIPFPGTYVLDEAGIVREKFFPRHIAMRESADRLLDSALGEILRSDEDPTALGGDDDVEVTAFFRGGPLKSGPRRQLVVRFELADGLHIYGDPVPDGMVATSITVEGPDGLHVGAPEFPSAEPFRLEAMNADLLVWSGRVDVSVPVWADSNLVCLMRPVDPAPVTLEVTVRYQACDDATCLLPRTETLRVEVPVAVHDVPAFLAGTGHRAVDMDSGTHWKALVEKQRRSRADREES